MGNISMTPGDVDEDMHASLCFTVRLGLETRRTMHRYINFTFIDCLGSYTALYIQADISCRFKSRTTIGPIFLPLLKMKVLIKTIIRKLFTNFIFHKWKQFYSLSSFSPLQELSFPKILQYFCRRLTVLPDGNNHIIFGIGWPDPYHGIYKLQRRHE